MVRLCSLSVGLIVSLAAVLPDTSAQPPKTTPAKPLPEVRIGLPLALFRDVPPALIDAAAQPFKEMIQKTLEMNGSLVQAKDYKVLAEQLKSKQIDIALFHGFEYAWIDHQDLVPLAVTRPSCGKVQACLVVNYNSKAEQPKDLKGACIAVPKGSKAHCQMFLEKIREKLPEDCKGDCCPISHKGTPPTAEDILDDVASGNGKCEAALVDVSQLLAYQADKPGLGLCLKVIFQSEILPSAVIVCRKDALTEQQRQSITRSLIDCTKNPQGKLFCIFWNLKGFGEYTDEYRTLVTKTREAYPAPISPKK